MSTINYIDNGNTLLGVGIRADYSRINGRDWWIVRPYNKEWSSEVQAAAPVLRVINSKQEAIEAVTS